MFIFNTLCEFASPKKKSKKFFTFCRLCGINISKKEFDRVSELTGKNNHNMKTLNSVKKLALGLAVGGMFVWQAGATGSWVAYTSPSGGSSTLSGYSDLANEVILSSSTLINELGVYDTSGFSGNTIKVAIYNEATGVLLSQVASFTGSPATVGNYAYDSITPITLGPGIYAVVASGYNSVDYNSAAALNIGLQAGTIQGNSTVGSANINFGNFAQLDTIAGAGTFGYLAPVPEAAGFTMAGVVLLGVVFFGRSYARKMKIA